jgi:hypothetical protein
MPQAEVTGVGVVRRGGSTVLHWAAGLVQQVSGQPYAAHAPIGIGQASLAGWDADGYGYGWFTGRRLAEMTSAAFAG